MDMSLSEVFIQETIASLLPDRSDSLLESEDVQRKQ
jgi:hypothetical protein